MRNKVKGITAVCAITKQTANRSKPLIKKKRLTLRMHADSIYNMIPPCQRLVAPLEINSGIVGIIRSDDSSNK